MRESETLQERLLRIVHEPASDDAEQVAHEVAASDEGQVYLVELVATLTALSPTNPAARRAEELLEQSMAIAGEHAVADADELASSTAATIATSTSAKDPGGGRKR